MSKKNNYRDVSFILQKLRNFLLGRKYTLHGRFPPLIASRTIPPPDIPRGPETKYSETYYFKRNAFNSVHPPVIAPVAEGLLLKESVKKSTTKAVKPDDICFNYAPTPGPAWWWDGHNYYDSTPDPPKKSEEKPSPCTPPSDKKA